MPKNNTASIFSNNFDFYVDRRVLELLSIEEDTCDVEALKAENK